MRKPCNLTTHNQPDWIGYLLGSWELTRTIDDQRQQKTGRLTGTARFVMAAPPDASVIDWQEQGIMAMAGYQGEAWQTYRLKPQSSGDVAVVFPDDRLFFTLPQGDRLLTIDHDCAPDSYKGALEIIDRDQWTLEWHVTGPRKNYRMASQYKRTAD